MAPEVLNKNYNEKCDIWSCGVILFVMLVGYPPFAGDKNEDIFKRIQRGTILFNCTIIIYIILARDWKNYSEEGKLLLNKMLTYDPVERISVEEALKDQWFAKFENKVEIESDKLLSSLQNLKKFRVNIYIYIYIVRRETPKSSFELHFYSSVLKETGERASKNIQ